MILGEGFNDAWQATGDGEDLGAPTLIDGNANGWWLDPTTDVTRVEIDWPVQRSLNIAFALTALAVLACLVLVVSDRRRRDDPIAAHVRIPRDPPASAVARSVGSRHGSRRRGVHRLGLGAPGRWRSGRSRSRSKRQWATRAVGAIGATIILGVGLIVTYIVRTDTPFPDAGWPRPFRVVARLDAARCRARRGSVAGRPRSRARRVSTRTIEYRPALDGLRAYAVVAVVLYHAGATSNLAGLAPGGFLGVSVFFTLSGYLVTTLLVRKSSSPTGFALGDFWARRLRRLAPVSIVVIVAAVLVSSRFWPGMQWTEAAAGLFGWSNWNVVLAGEDDLIRTIVGPLGPYWSLAVEEQFYVVLTIAVLVAWRTARPVRTLSIFVAIGWTSSLLVQILVSGPAYRLEFGTDSRGSELLAGCGLALMLHVRPTLTIRHSRQLAIAGPIAAAILLGLALTTDYDPPWLLHGGYAAVSLVSAALVAALLVPSPLTRALATRPTVAIGRLSYSWYVVHWPIILLLTEDRTGLDRWLLVGLKVAVSLAAAAALHLAVEQPIRAMTWSPARTGLLWLAVSCTTLAVALVVL